MKYVVISQGNLSINHLINLQCINAFGSPEKIEFLIVRTREINVLCYLPHSGEKAVCVHILPTGTFAKIWEMYSNTNADNRYAKRSFIDPCWLPNYFDFPPAQVCLIYRHMTRVTSGMLVTSPLAGKFVFYWKSCFCSFVDWLVKLIYQLQREGQWNDIHTWCNCSFALNKYFYCMYSSVSHSFRIWAITALYNFLYLVTFASLSCLPPPITQYIQQKLV